jgi:L-alanine-DL-glutamate epimerase-like enolase superfamily enzyme
VRRHYLDEYRGIVTQTLAPVDGEFPLPPGPGLGVELCAEVMEREDVTVERIE